MTARTVTLAVSDKIPAQVAFWTDSARVRGFVGGVGSGKTFAGCCEILRQQKRSVGCVIAESYKQLKSVTQKTFFELCPRPLVYSHNKTEQHTILQNGVEIFWRTAENPDAIRGLNLGWLYMDEAAFCSLESWRVGLGRLRKAPGRAWITTTPQGMDQWVYDEFVKRSAQNGYSLHKAKTDDNPFNISTYAKDLRLSLEDSPKYLQQEVDGEFVDLTGTKRFPPTYIDAVSSVQTPLDVNFPTFKFSNKPYNLDPRFVRVYEKPDTSKRYVIGADCAEGLSGADDSTGIVLDATSGDLCAVLVGELEPIREHPRALAALSRYYNRAPILPERNNHGFAVISGLERLGVAVLEGLDQRPGWNTTGPSKIHAMDFAYDVILQSKRSAHILLKDMQLIKQLKSIDRFSLKATKKKTKTKVDDVAIGWIMAQLGRLQAPTSSARSRQATTKMWG